MTVPWEVLPGEALRIPKEVRAKSQLFLSLAVGFRELVSWVFRRALRESFLLRHPAFVSCTGNGAWKLLLRSWNNSSNTWRKTCENHLFEVFTEFARNGETCLWQQTLYFIFVCSMSLCSFCLELLLLFWCNSRDIKEITKRPTYFPQIAEASYIVVLDKAAGKSH